MKNSFLIKISMIYLILIIFISCDSDKIRRNKLGSKTHIMKDENGNYWAIKHDLGDNYTIEFLGDSVYKK